MVGGPSIKKSFSPNAISLKLKSGVTSIGTIVKVSTSKFTWKTLDGTETSIKMSKLDKASWDLVTAWRAERKEIDSILKAKKPLTEAQKKLLLKHDVKIK